MEVQFSVLRLNVYDAEIIEKLHKFINDQT